MADNILVVQVELHKLIMAFPALIPKAVVVPVVAVKIDVEPVAVGGGFPVFQHILKRPETAAHMVEHTIQHHADAGFMQFAA